VSPGNGTSRIAWLAVRFDFREVEKI